MGPELPAMGAGGFIVTTGVGATTGTIGNERGTIPEIGNAVMKWVKEVPKLSSGSGTEKRVPYLREATLPDCLNPFFSEVGENLCVNMLMSVGFTP